MRRPVNNFFTSEYMKRIVSVNIWYYTILITCMLLNIISIVIAFKHYPSKIMHHQFHDQYVPLLETIVINNIMDCIVIDILVFLYIVFQYQFTGIIGLILFAMFGSYSIYMGLTLVEATLIIYDIYLFSEPICLASCIVLMSKLVISWMLIKSTFSTNPITRLRDHFN